MKSSFWGLKFSLALLAICAILPSSPATAAGKTPTGITVSPAYQQVNIPIGAEQQPAAFSITNDQTKPQTLDLSVADFNTLSETGGLFFVGSNPTQLQQKYGLAKWVTLPENRVTIPAKTTVHLKAEILDLSTLAPGGHYGALMLAVDNGGGTPSNVSLHPIASSLLFITKLDGATYKLSLSNVYVKHSALSLPSSVELRFDNVGNTHLTPRGVITLTNSSGKLISKGIINTNSEIVLPQSYRRYEVPLSMVSSPKLPGKYTLTVAYRFDGYSTYRFYQKQFLVVPAIDWLAPLLIVITICGFILRQKNRPKKAAAKKIEVRIK